MQLQKLAERFGGTLPKKMDKSLTETAKKEPSMEMWKFKKCGTLHEKDFMDKVKGYHDGTYKLTFDEEEYVKSLMAESAEMQQFKKEVFNDHISTTRQAQLKSGIAYIQRMTG